MAAKTEIEKFGLIDPISIANRLIESKPPEMKDKGILIVSLNMYRTLKFRKFNSCLFTYMKSWKQRAMFTIPQNIQIAQDAN